VKKEQERPKDLLNHICKASRVRYRQVVLKKGWFQKENGPLLGYKLDGNRPVALLPDPKTGYRLYDPVEKISVPMTDALSATLEPMAVMFYRPFRHQMITGFELLRFGFLGTQRDFFRILVAAAALGLLGLVVPIATGYIFETVIPQAEKILLLQISVILLVIAFSTLMFQIFQSIHVIRVEGKFDPDVNAAIMDRLLDLPVPFFRNFSAGDLAVRASGISEMRRLLSGAVLTSMLTGTFSLLNFALLFYYDSKLALIGLAVTLIAFFVISGTGYFQLKYQRELRDLEGKISGVVFQIITGISKLRVAGAEEYAFAYWAKRFAEQKRLAFRARLISNRLLVFNSILPVIAAAVIYWWVAFGSGGMSIGTGDFLAFNAAFTQFLVAVITMSASLILVASTFPFYERVRPILQSLPETDEAKASPGELSGEIEVSHVTFRYEADGPPILKEISVRIEPGQFVAFVGPSGSGKSTLFRLLLGFENPERGTIQYDGQDLSVLDVDAVRHQIGVVLQQSRIMPGNIFHNIVGSSLLTMEDAWEAARMAGLEQDIQDMPMGMHTVIGEGASTFSGGQRQRLLIARAIANKPRILLFDEATSALDNRTQEVVSESLERLQATRIVIAHRLSTILNADRIFVMQDGRIVQSGTYQELIDQPGLFADLAKRQMI
jgi:ATP-binding cassette subfamily C protein